MQEAGVICSWVFYSNVSPGAPEDSCVKHGSAALSVWPSTHQHFFWLSQSFTEREGIIHCKMCSFLPFFLIPHTVWGKSLYVWACFLQYRHGVLCYACYFENQIKRWPLMFWVRCSRVKWTATLPLALEARQGLETFSSGELTETGWQTEPANPVQSRPLDHTVQKQRMGFPISKGFQKTDAKQTNQSITHLAVTISQMTSFLPSPQRRSVVPRSRRESLGPVSAASPPTRGHIAF